MSTKQPLILALGTNHHRHANMQQAQALLSVLLDDVVFSSSRLTTPIGMHSADFLNCLAMGGTLLSLPALQMRLKAIETQCGNTREKRAAHCIEMDIDVLEYGGERLHEADWQRSYVAELLTELHSK